MYFVQLRIAGEKLVKEYLKTTHRWNSLSVDIEGFITEFMGEKVEYPYFAEEDPNRIGFAGDGINALLVWNGNTVEEKVYDDRTIVIDRSMLDVEQSGRRRYTLAHEAAHKILKKARSAAGSELLLHGARRFRRLRLHGAQTYPFVQ